MSSAETYIEEGRALCEKQYMEDMQQGGAMSRQVGGNHYLGKKITHWGIVDEYNLDHYRGSAIKYIIRDKNNRYEDIQKAIHYLEKWLEVNKEIK